MKKTIRFYRRICITGNFLVGLMLLAVLGIFIRYHVNVLNADAPHLLIFLIAIGSYIGSFSYGLSIVNHYQRGVRVSFNLRSVLVIAFLVSAVFQLITLSQWKEFVYAIRHFLSPQSRLFYHSGLDLIINVLPVLTMLLLFFITFIYEILTFPVLKAVRKKQLNKFEFDFEQQDDPTKQN